MSSSREAVAEVRDGRVVSASRGETVVLARFDDLAAAARVIVVADDRPFPPTAVEARHEIDRRIFDKLDKLRIRPVGLCDDPTFLRRVTLDLIGHLPTLEETRGFLADERDDKRSRWVETLLARTEFADSWAKDWAEILRVEERRLGYKGVAVYTGWLQAAFRDHVPFDQMVQQLLTSEGSSFREAPANYYCVSRSPKIMAEDAAQAFLGVRLQCAQCHNHPFDRWTMDDYYGFAAFFGQVTTKTGEDPRERIVFDSGSGEVLNPRTRSEAAPRFLGGGAPELPDGTDRRAVLSAWLTAPENPYFAANVANRVWARLFGRGIVDPPDDRRVSNPPSHPELFERLGMLLVDSEFDIRSLVRMICSTHTYQSEVPAAAGGMDSSAFAGVHVRRLSAEALLDAIDQVTGVATRHRGAAPGASAAAVTGGDPSNRFLDLFGRPRRQSSCSCERGSDPTLGQVLHLINGQTIDAKLRAPRGRLRVALAAGLTPEAMLEELFLVAYCRRPAPDEASRLLADVVAAEDATAAWEDVYWAVLNSKEFLFQH